MISDDKLSIRVEQDPPHPTDPCASLPEEALPSATRADPFACHLKTQDTVLLTITYSTTYPDELPEIGIETLEGDLGEEEEEELVMGLIAAVGPSFFSPATFLLGL